MSFLAQQSSAPNFYAQVALDQTASTLGVCPNYYDHYRLSVDKGFFNFVKPARKDGVEEHPFEPNNAFTLKDIHGNRILHSFCAIEAMPIGYFIGANLFNYEQALPGERPGSHCETVSAELKIGGTPVANVSGRHPLQTSSRVNYSFRKYNSDPGEYANDNFMTYGRATAEYAKAVDRPQVMSCGECLSRNLDKYQKNQCRTTGEFALYVYRVAYLGPEGKPVWLSVDELGLPNIKSGFVAVMPLGAADLRKPKTPINLAAAANRHIPAHAICAHEYVTGLYRRNDPNLMPFIKACGGDLQTLCYPSQLWVAELAKDIGKISKAVLFNEAPAGINLDLAQKHAMLEQALTAYDNERKQDDSFDLKFYEPPAAASALPEAQLNAQEVTPSSAVAPASAVAPDLNALAQKAAASNLFNNYKPQ